MSDKADRRQSVQSVEVGMRVLRCVAETGRSVPLAVLAKQSGLAPAKAHRYLVALAKAGFVVQDARTGHYLLGPEALAVGLSALSQLDVVSIAEQSLAKFADSVNECCFLAVWGTCGPTIVRWQESTRPVTINVRVGSVMPILTSATGQVFLAWSKHDALGSLMNDEWNQGKRQSNRVLRSKSDVEELQRRTRSLGFVTVKGSMLTGIAAASAPVFDAQGNLCAAITTVGPSEHLDLSTKGRVIEALLETARMVSQQLGWRGAKK